MYFSLSLSLSSSAVVTRTSPPVMLSINVYQRNKVIQTVHGQFGNEKKIYIGGFQLEFVSISRVINHMTCYNSSALIALVENLF